MCIRDRLQDELDELQKKLDEETALNEQLLAASQDEEKDAKQELRDKEQELEHTRMAYEALLTAMNCDTREEMCIRDSPCPARKRAHQYPLPQMRRAVH